MGCAAIPPGERNKACVSPSKGQQLPWATGQLPSPAAEVLHSGAGGAGTKGGSSQRGDHPEKTGRLLKLASHRPFPKPPVSQRSWSRGREQPSRTPAKTFVGAEACINILFDQGLWVNTVYSGSVQREQLQPCGAGASDAPQRWQSDLLWHCPGSGVLSTVTEMAASRKHPSAPSHSCAPEESYRPAAGGSACIRRAVAVVMPCRTWFGTALVRARWAGHWAGRALSANPTAALPVCLWLWPHRSVLPRPLPHQLSPRGASPQRRLPPRSPPPCPIATACPTAGQTCTIPSLSCIVRGAPAVPGSWDPSALAWWVVTGFSCSVHTPGGPVTAHWSSKLDSPAAW